MLLCLCPIFFFVKQKTADEMRISDWSSDVCSSDLVPLGLGAQPRMVRTVEGDDRGAAVLEPLENLALGVGDRFFAAEIFHMRGGDGGDHGDMRADHARQRGEFARMVHPHFEDAVVGGRWHTREAQRPPAMIVITLDRKSVV